MEVSWKATTNSIKMIFLDALVLHIIFPTLLETKEFLIKVDVSLLFQMWVLSTVAFFFVFVPHYATGQFNTNPESMGLLILICAHLPSV